MKMDARRGREDFWYLSYQGGGGNSRLEVLLVNPPRFRGIPVIRD